MYYKQIYFLNLCNYFIGTFVMFYGLWVFSFKSAIHMINVFYSYTILTSQRITINKTNDQASILIEKRLFELMCAVNNSIHCTYIHTTIADELSRIGTLNKRILKTILRLYGSACPGKEVSILKLLSLIK